MQQWEYMMGHLDTYGKWHDSMGHTQEVAAALGNAYDLTPIFNRLGTEGWELVGHEGEAYIFKRPKP
jgi:hypothetical protein